MKNYGDIAQIHGGNVEPAWVVIGGSPCQDLSVAGKRAGLEGERSGLFMDQIRVIKEMRWHDRSIGRTGADVRPRWMVWENVPGAFSSAGGEDFRAVLEETARVAEEGITIPRPADGKWQTAGCIMGDGWSVAWRVLDAQYWGVPQRRRRIALVADFAGKSAGEILFKREGLSGYPETGGEAREGSAGDAGEGIEGAGGCLTPWDYQSKRVFDTGGVMATLPARNDKTGQYDVSVFCLQGNGIDRADTAGCNGCGWREDVSYTLNTIDRPAVACVNSSGNGVSATLDSCYGVGQGARGGIEREYIAVFDARGNGDGDTVCTLTGDHQNRITDYTALCIGNGQVNNVSFDDKANTLDTMHDQQAVYIPDVSAVDCRNGVENPDVNGTLQAKPNGGQSLNMQNVVRVKKTVRRLTPLECERLQGFPDYWTDIGEWTGAKGKRHDSSDSARYKALGNSIALPPWRYVLSGIYPLLPDGEKTMASLFDGIGGFPLIWRELGGATVWVSEIEPFCCAVVARRFE